MKRHRAVNRRGRSWHGTAAVTGTTSNRVWADKRVFQQIEVSGPEEAYREAQKFPGDFEACSHGIEDFDMAPEVIELDIGESFRVGEPEHGTLRQASQRFYNAVSDYIREPDGGLPAELVEAMDGLEAAVDEADGTTPESPDEA